MSNILEQSTLWSTEVPFNADVVSWFPPSFKDTFLCGQYQLIEDKGERVGGLDVFKFDGENSCESVQNIPSAGVLDVKWMSKGDETYLILALADGYLSLASLESNGVLNPKRTCVGSNESSIVMSLDVSELDFGLVASCDTTGHLTLQNLFNNTELTQWQAHEYEIWAVAFDKHDSNRLFSGGDDCSLKCWDLRTDHKKAIFQSKQHSMGVTSLAVCAHTENCLASGSYDEFIKFWDCRNMKSSLKEVNVGGGVWRLRWNQKEDFLVAACMHDGFKVLNSNFEEIANYRKHGSLAYGVDLRSIPSEDGSECLQIISCSFYDKALHLWNVT